jgi:hypothetical protein
MMEQDVVGEQPTSSPSMKSCENCIHKLVCSAYATRISLEHEFLQRCEGFFKEDEKTGMSIPFKPEWIALNCEHHANGFGQ